MKLIKLDVTGDYKGAVYQCIDGGAVTAYRDENGAAVDFEALVVEMTTADQRPTLPEWASA